MKKTIAVVLITSALMPLSLFGQTSPPPRDIKAVVENTAPPALRFDLDFPGGKPSALVAAIEKATGKPLNAIIPKDYADIEIPPLKMSGVTVSELFDALQMASVKLVTYRNAFPGAYAQSTYSSYNSSYGFQSKGKEANRVWYFRAEMPPQPLPAIEVCRYYQLAPLLTQYKIEDITTAIRTGWAMLQVTKEPQLKFHPETKLLIAVGSEENLKIIESVLEQLKGSLARDGNQAAQAAPGKTNAPAKKDSGAKE